jgi:two-component system, sensor histidine kinase and response regulator
MMHMIDMTGILLGTPLTGEQREFEGTVRSNADALLSTMNGILDFPKIEAEKLAIESIDFDLRTTIESVVELMVEHAQRKGHELTALICHDAPTRLRGDPGRLRQVLTNPINTAIKFTAHSEVIVNTTKESKTDTHAVVCVEVRDIGTGIPQEAQGRPFQAFSGADGWTTRQYGGIGLGLAISRQLVDLMGGTISVESIPGRGATFWFTLRLHRQPSVEGSSRQLPTTLDGVQVLVVNDNATNRKILHYQLKGWSMRHDSAADGCEALAMLFREAAASDSHTLAILDMQMPEMDGLQLAQAIKTAPITASVRLLIMTSLSYDGDDRRFEDAGLLTFLTKPVKQSNSLTI